MDKYPPAARATEATTLEEQIMESRFPKNEREWWAKREIERLRAENSTLRNVGISQMEQINRLLAQQLST